MKTKIKYFRVTLYIILSMLLISCSSIQLLEADYKHPSFHEMDVNTIAVMPILDRRETKNDLELDDNILPAFQTAFEERGYEYSFITNKSLIENLTIYDFLPEFQPAIKSLELENTKWIMYIVVNKAAKEFEGLFARGHSRLSGYIYNQHTGEKVWEGSGEAVISANVMWAALVDDNSLIGAATEVSFKIPLNSKVVE